MAPRDLTAVEQLRETGRYLDYSLLPTLNELPAIVAALAYDKDGKVSELVDQARKDGKGDPEIAHDVSHLIAPPDPDAGATVTQGIPVAQHQQLQAEVQQLRALVEQMSIQNVQAAQGPPEAPVGSAPGGISAAGQLSADQQELQDLREQVQQLRVQAAAGQHPTVEHATDSQDSPTPASAGGESGTPAAPETAPPESPSPPNGEA